MQPYEVVVGPQTLYLAAVGVAFPAIDAVPSGSWFKLGTAGTKNYDPAGTTVNHGDTIAEWTGAGSTAPRKAMRTDESFKIGFTLVDLTPEQYAKILDDVAITTTAQSTGVAGNKAFEVLRGLKVKAFALIARGDSAIDDSLAAQYEVACCYQSGQPAPVFAKGAPAGLAVEYTALERTPGVFATSRTQSTVAG
jgi:hypothetical protein